MLKPLTLKHHCANGVKTCLSKGGNTSNWAKHLVDKHLDLHTEFRMTGNKLYSLCMYSRQPPSLSTKVALEKN